MINLIKGQRVEIEAGLTRLRVEMGWKVNPNAKPPYDLDASTFLLGSNGQIENEYDFVFYGSGNQAPVLDNSGKPLYDEEGNPVMRPVSVDKSVLGSVDDLGDDDDNTGEGNEEIDVDLTKTSPRVNEIFSRQASIGARPTQITQNSLHECTIISVKFVMPTYR